MSGEIVGETAMTMAEVQEHLKQIKKRDGELNFRANKTEENLNAIVQIKHKDALALKKKLEELEIPRLKDIHVCKIIDILPRSVDELKMILQGYTITVNNENLKKILEAVKEYTAQ